MSGSNSVSWLFGGIAWRCCEIGQWQSKTESLIVACHCFLVSLCVMAVYSGLIMLILSIMMV